ncbi:MAG: hypothetical protein LBG48_00300 [Rickettsiales bacterium]|jgi:hypothetical protein|nr:hypothetical protein [Rickettsiales bacterium]
MNLIKSLTWFKRDYLYIIVIVFLAISAMRSKNQQLSLLRETKTKHEGEILSLKEEHKNIMLLMENDYKNNLKSLQERNDRLKSSNISSKDLINNLNESEDLNECYINNTIPKSIQKILKDSE